MTTMVSTDGELTDTAGRCSTVTTTVVNEGEQVR